MTWARRIAGMFIAPADEQARTTGGDPRPGTPPGSAPPSHRAPRVAGEPPSHRAPGVAGEPPSHRAPGVGGEPLSHRAPQVAGEPPSHRAPGVGGEPPQHPARRDTGARRSRRAPRNASQGRRSSVAGRPPAAVAVLAPAADAPALGAALGMALARAGGVPICVVCVWSPDPARTGWRAPPMPAAARLASTLRERGHEASASGRLVVVRLSPEGEEAASQALRVGAAAGCAPTVVVLGGPRAAAFDALLAMQDLVVVGVAAATDASLAELASAGLERALTCAVPPADPARALAAAGLVLLPSTRRALAAPVAALS